MLDAHRLEKHRKWQVVECDESVPQPARKRAEAWVSSLQAFNQRSSGGLLSLWNNVKFTLMVWDLQAQFYQRFYQ
jgi:hypothetical protein